MSKKDSHGQGKETTRISQTELSNNLPESYVVDTKLPPGESITTPPRQKLLMWLIISNPVEHRGDCLTHRRRSSHRMAKDFQTGDIVKAVVTKGKKWVFISSE